MNANKALPQYNVLNPWADADPIPLRAITERLSDLEGKTLGLFHNSKRAALPIMNAVEKKLKERYPSMTFNRFVLMPNAGVDETDEKDRFEEWVKGVDGVILSYGD
jgi:hypothetical protein